MQIVLSKIIYSEPVIKGLNYADIEFNIELSEFDVKALFDLPIKDSNFINNLHNNLISSENAEINKKGDTRKH